jgi:hypothetical protein
MGRTEIGSLLMPTRRHPWKRFWCPRGGTFNLSDDGYLVDPDGKYGATLNAGLVSADSFYDQPCVILLGEPGIGKTDGIRSIRSSESASPQSVQRKFLSFDLHSYGSDERFIREVLENDVVEDWLRGDGIMHMFIDSLDEGLLRVDTISGILGERIPKFPLDRLRFRIACRSAEWPKTLEGSLREAWGKDSISAYELVPLRKKDVEVSLPIGVDRDSFMGQIDLSHAAPLAIKPITLKFLTNLYLKTGYFPSSQSQLYLDGCRVLCEENNDFRRDTIHRPTLSADQRLAIAMRIAAATIFANRNAIWTGPERGDELPEDLTLRALSGGTESIGESKLEISEAALKETLGTGLFSLRGVERLGWAHQTYSEFLAARYVFEHKLTTDQLNTLILHTGDSAAKVVPQLGEVSAWIASMVPDIFHELALQDPEVLLRSDVSTVSDVGREDLTRALLTSTDNEQIFPIDLSIRSNLGKLNHPKLAGHLSQYVNQPAKSDLSRNLAIDIAKACQVTSLGGDLASVALDRTQSIRVRINAAHAVARIGGEDAKARLRPLATEIQEDDTDDELKGCALQAVWPHSLSSDELFKVITPFKSPSLFGAYRSFVDYQLAKQIRASDLPPAFAWMEENGQVSPYDTLGNLADAIILKGWENLDKSGVPNALAHAILPRLRSQHQIFSHSSSRQDENITLFRSELFQNDSKRRIMLTALLPLLEDAQYGRFYAIFCNPPFALRKDLFYLLSLLKESPDPGRKRFIATIVERLLDWNDRQEIDAILSTSETEPVLAEVMAWMIRPIELGSAAAEQMKREFREIKELEERRNEQTKAVLTPSPQERVLRCLDEIESGKSAIWATLCMELTLEPTSTHYGNGHESDIRELPGWTAADSATRLRITSAAKQFILESDPNTQRWIGKDSYSIQDISGYKAFCLVLREAPEFLQSMDAAAWTKWAPSILACPIGETTADDNSLSDLLTLAYSKAPTAILATLDTLIDHDIASHQHVFTTDKILGIWDSALAALLLMKAKSPNLNATSLASLLDLLLSKQNQEACVFAQSLITAETLSNTETKERAIAAARTLLTRWCSVAWPTIWPIVQSNRSVGKQLIESVSYFPGNQSQFPSSLSDDNLGTLYVWLVQQYPYLESAKGGFGFVSPAHSATMLRDNVLTILKARGTTEAIDALAGVVGDLPDLKWLKFHLFEAQNIMRRRTWIPPQPEEVLIIARDAQARLVQSGEQLLNVILESLVRLQQKLHGETPLVPFLWNESAKKMFTPKDENALSDFIKVHFDDDLVGRGIVINREVRIHRGQLTDIHVTALVRGKMAETLDQVTAIIEVKCSWNPELKTAMETQLVSKYLTENRCQHGLYLVGWYASDSWDEADNRRGKQPKLGLGDARAQFAAQAADLSDSGLDVRTFILDASLNSARSNLRKLERRSNN